MKPLFLITSALNPSYGVFASGDRVKQTKLTIDSIKKYAPDADIFLADISVNGLTEEIKNEIIGFYYT